MPVPQLEKTKQKNKQTKKPMNNKFLDGCSLFCAEVLNLCCKQTFDSTSVGMENVKTGFPSDAIKLMWQQLSWETPSVYKEVIHNNIDFR